MPAVESPPQDPPPNPLPAKSQVRVKLVAQQPQYAVAAGTLLVPTALEPQGLSDLVNKLRRGQAAVPFAFMIDGQLLRRSLQEYLDEHVLSSENVLTVEYFEAAPAPEKAAALDEPDWIAAVRAHPFASLLLSGSYDGHFRVWRDSGKSPIEVRAHERAVKAVAWLLPETGRRGVELETCVTGDMDGRIRGWQFPADSLGDGVAKVSRAFEAVGHDDCVTGLARSGSGAFFASSAADATVRIWATGPPEADERAEQPSKRVRGAAPVAEKHAAAVLEGHAGPVLALAYISGGAGAAGALAGDATLVSAGSDHALRVWDVERESLARAMSAEAVARSVAAAPGGAHIATGHVDRRVRIWDPRATTGAACKLGLAPTHRSWVSGVVWSPTHDQTLASVGLDGLAKVWDIRSPRSALYQLSAGSENPGRLFSVDWAHDRVVAGGESEKLFMWTVKSS